MRSETSACAAFLSGGVSGALASNGWLFLTVRLELSAVDLGLVLVLVLAPAPALVLALVPVLVLTAVLSFAVVLPLVSGCPSGFFFFFFFFVNEIGLKSLRAWFGGAVGWWGGGAVG